MISNTCGKWAEIALNKMRTWENLSIKARKRKISSLNSFCEWLSTYQKIQLQIPIEAPSDRARKLPNFISVDEVHSLIQYLSSAPDSPIKTQQELLFLLLYGLGLRLSEACEARTSNLSLMANTLKVMGKGSKERLTILPVPVTVRLGSLPLGEPFLFGDKPLPTRTAYKRIRDLGAAAGLLKPIHPHALRHSYATHLLTSGSDLRVLQQLLGHQSLAATELYTHLDQDHLANTLESHHPLSKK